MVWHQTSGVLRRSRAIDYAGSQGWRTLRGRGGRARQVAVDLTQFEDNAAMRPSAGRPTRLFPAESLGILLGIVSDWLEHLHGQRDWRAHLAEQRLEGWERFVQASAGRALDARGRWTIERGAAGRRLLARLFGLPPRTLARYLRPRS